LEIFSQFLYRLSFGLAAGMALTSPRLVAAGFFRNHLYALLGLNVLTVLVASSSAGQFALWPCAAAAVLSYLGAVFWLYDAASPGRACLVLIALLSLTGAYLMQPTPSPDPTIATLLWTADPLLSGWLLGGVLTAMLLGHWYLNAPGMQLAPLKRLILLAGAGLGLRSLQFASGLYLNWQANDATWSEGWAFWMLHGVAGLIATAPVLWMAWETLKIPNPQSATGILYVAVILTFLGEIAGLLISAQARYPI
jgi:hypothetical protein